jgi:hypothetical protein
VEMRPAVPDPIAHPRPRIKRSQPW